MKTPIWDAAVLDEKRLVARAQRCQAYQFCDPFDNYNTLSSLWEFTAGSPVIGTAYRRFTPPAGLPGQGLYLPSGAYARKNLQSNQATVIGKVSYFPLTATGSGGSEIMGFVDGTGGGYQTALVWQASGALQIWTAWASPYATLRASTGPGIIAANAWYGIEMLLTISSSAGVAQVWVNGIQVLNVSSINTESTSSGIVNQLQISDGTLGCYYDDVRVWDNTGSFQCAPLGTDSRLITKLPNGAGGYTNWTPNGAAANWQCVDDNPPDGDTTYVSCSSTGTAGWDDYTMPSAGFTLPPVMVVARSYVRKDDSATRTMSVGVWRGLAGQTGYTQGGSPYTVGSTYQFTDACIVADPNAGAAWTASTADAALHFKTELS